MSWLFMCFSKESLPVHVACAVLLPTASLPMALLNSSILASIVVELMPAHKDSPCMHFGSQTWQLDATRPDRLQPDSFSYNVLGVNEVNSINRVRYVPTYVVTGTGRVHMHMLCLWVLCPYCIPCSTSGSPDVMVFNDDSAIIMLCSSIHSSIHSTHTRAQCRTTWCKCRLLYTQLCHTCMSCMSQWASFDNALWVLACLHRAWFCYF
jgi:hypothetical protein